VSAVEFAVIMLPVLLLIFLVIQAGLYYHAVNVAQAVAQTTARVVRAYPGAPGQVDTRIPSQAALQGAGDDAAVQTWSDLDTNKTMSRPAVRVWVDADNQVHVIIRARSVNLLPAILPDLWVTAAASGPIEIFKPTGTN
jgi:TadE-like protein